MTLLDIIVLGIALLFALFGVIPVLAAVLIALAIIAVLRVVGGDRPTL